MEKLKALPLTKENFHLYGEFRHMDDLEGHLKGEPGDSEFYPDLLTLNLSGTTLPSVCLAKVKKTQNDHPRSGIPQIYGGGLTASGRRLYHLRGPVLERV